nr:MAG TPA: hypothetical protein [Caudoviricetes sp.]
MNTRDDWKSLKLAVLEMEYGKQAEVWNDLYPPVSDDRRVYINIYHQLIDAVKSLTDNPNSIVCVAMNRYIAGEKKCLMRLNTDLIFRGGGYEKF